MRDLDPTIFEEDIGRFQVPVNNVKLVEGGNTQQHLLEDSKGLGLG